jgi:uncharacterized protein YdeI (YjbR/CyaY-like superfamily)
MTDFPILPFDSASKWHEWLSKHYVSPGVWIQIYKKASGKKTITYQEALDEALCFGWIDGQAKSLDAQSYIQKFTPRGPRSMWSKKNRENIARLTKEGRMKPSGEEAVAKAKADGRWASAYDSPANMKIPDDFLNALEKNPTIKKFYSTLNKANLYVIGWKLQTAKTPVIRMRRMQMILEKLAKGEKFHD